MWSGVFPAVTTKFTGDGQLDHGEMERCFSLLTDAGCDGLIVAGSLGEGPMLSNDEKLSVFATARKVAGKRPVLMTINEAGTREAAVLAKAAAKAGADGLMVVDSLSGESLADRIGRTPDWRQFALYRAAPRSGALYVTFALSGLGEAWLDDVEIQVLQ